MRLRQLYRSALPGLLAVAALATASAGEPRVFLDGRGRLVISALPPLLTEADVERHLDSGLTTSFVFRARPRGPLKPGAARIDIRFELWDEVYLVTVLDGEGRLEKSRHDSAQALGEWWSSVEIVLSMPAVSTDRPTGTGPGSAAFETAILGSQVRVSLAVVPFSQAELVDTQRWLIESMAQAQGGSRDGNEGGASRAVGALIATSMQRRAVRSMTWSLPIVRRDMP